MKYQETIDFLYKQIPAFERQGASGYKPGLGTAIALDDWLGNPHRAYKCIHVAGTNGKGSVSRRPIWQTFASASASTAR